jgi:hypothetical protein
MKNVKTGKFFGEAFPQSVHRVAVEPASIRNISHHTATVPQSVAAPANCSNVAVIKAFLKLGVRPRRVGFSDALIQMWISDVGGVVVFTFLSRRIGGIGDDYLLEALPSLDVGGVVYAHEIAFVLARKRHARCAMRFVANDQVERGQAEIGLSVVNRLN